MKRAVAVGWIALALMVSLLVESRGGSAASRAAAVDGEGVLRWQDGGSELALFGVNYYPPFHWNYRDLGALGLSHREVMDRDLAHLARLGLEVIRLHVFDREISDAEGNLVENEHLSLLDHLIAKAWERGIYTVLTPIAWWPVPGESPGFSTRFSMQQMTTERASWGPQTRYLDQFLRHVNLHTGQAYKDDPAVVALELINEPLYPPGTTDQQVTDYINALADAARATGTRKPVFYNGWQRRLAAVARARVEGSSFGWYPTGLVSGRAWTRNALPLVNAYGGTVWNPPMTAPEMEGKARIVYEFDAADIAGSYLYPAMARAFRSGGAQIATQFQYDPLPLASCNAGWQTHYLNLSYAPNKTLSFAIAGEAFRRLPRLRGYPPHPEGDRFGEFRVSYEEDLSEMVSATAFLYSNATRTVPAEVARLERIAGCGSSPVVRYTGSGAYFLDRLGAGAWRLEVHPDAVWLADPFGQDKLGREVSRVIWRTREMEPRLPGLGEDFEIEPLNAGNTHQAKAVQGVVAVRPGVYHLHAAGAASLEQAGSGWKHAVGLREFVAPGPAEQAPAVWMPLPAESVAGRAVPLRATLASEEEPAGVAVELLPADGGAPERLPMSAEGPYRWAVTLPGERLKPGTLSLRLAADWADRSVAFPTAGGWQVPVVEPSAPVTLFEYGRDLVRAQGQQPNRVKTVAGLRPGSKAARVEVDRFDPPPAALSFRCEAADRIEHRRADLRGRGTLVLRVRAARPETRLVEIVLVERDGTPWGTNVALSGEWQERRVPLASLQFFRHWAGAPAGRGGAEDRIRPEEVSAFNVCFGAWQVPGHHEAPHGIEIESVSIE